MVGAPVHWHMVTVPKSRPVHLVTFLIPPSKSTAFQSVGNLPIYVIPIHKKGGTSDPNNFRPISLTSTCCRVMERIINNKLIDFLHECNLITRHQHGFIRKRTTDTNLLECLYGWTVNLQSREVTDVIHFDFKKAFDSVSHLKLLSKL